MDRAGVSYEDCGAFKYDKNDDYTDFSHAVAKKVAENPEASKGILLCGSGRGVDIVANKVRNAYSVLVWNDKELAFDEKANVLSLPADFLSENEATAITKKFLEAVFPLPERKERDERRMEKIKKIEDEHFK